MAHIFYVLLHNINAIVLSFSKKFNEKGNKENYISQSKSKCLVQAKILITKDRIKIDPKFNQ